MKVRSHRKQDIWEVSQTELLSTSLLGFNACEYDEICPKLTYKNPETSIFIWEVLHRFKQAKPYPPSL